MPFGTHEQASRQEVCTGELARISPCFRRLQVERASQDSEITDALHHDLLFTNALQKKL
jgi:hypothetical protein